LRSQLPPLYSSLESAQANLRDHARKARLPLEAGWTMGGSNFDHLHIDERDPLAGNKRVVKSVASKVRAVEAELGDASREADSIHQQQIDY
jgi:hypothetical protein